MYNDSDNVVQVELLILFWTKCDISMLSMIMIDSKRCNQRCQLYLSYCFQNNQKIRNKIQLKVFNAE